ncbi:MULTISPECIES: DUF2637 domain-containing protein [unclassified Streptomyces]|uniref:DUF2637 domain-containing protein n=1 Tax=unclassified Streptomyces TaxID=2593676 RepID=UPI000CD4D7D1|nr:MULTISPECIES: DUF2637 domain-containing protein [unclassified Streptomyces]
MTQAPALPGTAAIRAGIALLGATGFTLSYDALRQMAVAIHIRGPLTYVFPLVIDGFIAIGIVALLILRAAPQRSRLYVWLLVGIATVTSIWANALHAVRLNQNTNHHHGLRLDNATVGALSAIAPLALAGAVHLYLVVRRHTTAGSHPRHNATRHVNGTTRSHKPDAAPDKGHRPDATRRSAASVVAPLPATDVATTPSPSATPDEPRPSVTDQELLALGRNAPRGRGGRISRRNIEAAVRDKGYRVGRNRLDEATRTLQTELDTATVGTE